MLTSAPILLNTNRRRHLPHKGAEFVYMLLLNINRKAHMGSLIPPPYLTLGDLEMSISLRFEVLHLIYMIEEPSWAIFY